jgi:hypothetical protein
LDFTHDRLTPQAGDFFVDPLPAADAYVLMDVIHDWPDAECVAILRAIRAAASTGATALIIENVLPENGGDPRGAPGRCSSDASGDASHRDEDPAWPVHIGADVSGTAVTTEGAGECARSSSSSSGPTATDHHRWHPSDRSITVRSARPGSGAACISHAIRHRAVCASADGVERGGELVSATNPLRTSTG